MSGPSKKWFARVGLPGQFSTWYEHGTLADVGPFVVAAILKLATDIGTPVILLVAAILGTIGGLEFFLRERGQVKGKTKSGLHAAYLHAPLEWISPYADFRGDLVGPYTAWLAYWFAFLLSVLP